MYITHFGLKDYPFGGLSSSAELFESDQLKEALAHFLYALENHEPFFLLTGEVGTGKSAIVQAILAQLPPETPGALVNHTSLSSGELLIEVLLKFGLGNVERVSKRRLLYQLEEFFAGCSSEGRRPVLILDEAHLLSDSFLEELRLLSNLQREGRPILQICLVGQPELSERLRQEHLRQLRQRIAVRYELKVLTKQETGAYLEKRLEVAGCVRPKELFSGDATDAIFRLTGGYPREVNVRARQALLNAYLDDALVVTRDHVLAAREFGFEGVRVVRRFSPSPPSSTPAAPAGFPPAPPAENLSAAHESAPLETPSAPIFSYVGPVGEAPILSQADPVEIQEHTGRTWSLLVIFLLLGGTVAAVYLHWFSPRLAESPPRVPLAANGMTDAPVTIETLPDSEPDDLPTPVETPAGETLVGATQADPLPSPAVPDSEASQIPSPATPPVPRATASVAAATTSPSNLPRTEPARAGTVRSSVPGNVTRDPRSLAANRVEQGVALAKGQALEAAVAAFGQAIELDPSYAEAHYNLGLARLRQGDLDGSTQALRKAVSIRADNQSAYRHLGIALWKQGQLDEAVAAFRKAIALNPNDALAHHNLALALRDQGALDEAIEELRQAVALDPRDAIAQHNLGITLRDKGRTSEAIDAYRKAIELNPRDALAYFNLGAAFSSESRFEDAIYVLQQALYLSPDDPQMHNSLGSALRSTNRPEAAMAAFSRAIELDPDYALAHYNLALTLGHLGRKEEARREFEVSQRLGYESLSSSKPRTQ